MKRKTRFLLTHGVAALSASAGVLKNFWHEWQNQLPGFGPLGISLNLRHGLPRFPAAVEPQDYAAPAAGQVLRLRAKRSVLLHPLLACCHVACRAERI